jgi:hypothetical protein
MPPMFQLNTAADYWLEMAVPDCSEYFANKESLRCALHAAISLFHMSDWIFHTHEAVVRANLTFKDRNGTAVPVSDPATFATSLEQQFPDFGLIRGIAHAAKHLKLNNVRPVPNAPSHAADTAVHPSTFSPNIFAAGVFDTGRKVMLASANGNDLAFEKILRSVYAMWTSLQTTYGW